MTTSALVQVLGNISAIVTIEEAGRSWFKDFKKMISKDEFDLAKYSSNDEIINRDLDHLKQWLEDNSRVELFSKSEIKEIKKQVHKYGKLNIFEKTRCDKTIDVLFWALNKYIDEHLSMGEKIIISKQNDILEKQDMILEQMNRREASEHRFITEMAPNPPSRFAYRNKELKVLEELIASGNNIAITGVGGIGKTAILRYIYQERYNSTDLYLGWVQYSGDLKRNILDSCICFREIQDMNIRYDKLKSYMCEKNKSVLLFLDNASDDLLKDSEFEFWAKTVKVYISTRRWTEDEMFKSYEISNMEEADALELFWEYYGKVSVSKTVSDMVRELIADINYHTLMIEMVAKAAQYADESLEKFIEKVKEIGYQYSPDEIKTAHDKNEETIAGHLIKLYQLESDEQDRNYILYNFAIMKNDILPFEFCKWIQKEKDEKINRADFRWLLDRGWIQRVDNGYYMHPVIKESILLQRRASIDDVKPLLTAINADNFFYDDLDINLMNQRLDIAGSLLEYFDPYNGDDAKVFVITEIYTFVCCMQSRFQEAILIGEKQYLWGIDKYGNHNNKYSTDALLNLAKIYVSSRYYEKALECCNKLRKIYMKMYEPNDIHFFDLGEIYIRVCNEIGQYELAAREYYELANMNNPKIDEVRMLKIKMGFCSMLINKYIYMVKNEKMNEQSAQSLYLSEAKKILENIQQLMFETYGEEHLETLIWYQNMANVYSYMGQYDKSKEYNNKIIKIREEKLGDKSMQLADAYINMAGDLFELAQIESGSAQDALDYMKKAYGIAVAVNSDYQYQKNIEEFMEGIQEYQTFYLANK